MADTYFSGDLIGSDYRFFFFPRLCAKRDMAESDDAAKPRSAEEGASSAGGADMSELEVSDEKRVE